MNARLRELTPRGRGAVTVLEVVGGDARASVRDLLSRVPEPGELCVARVRDGADELDEAIVVCDRADRVELQLTGSPPLVERVRELLEEAGVEAAEAEPASLESRAAAYLAAAPSEVGARLLLDQAEGALRRELLALADLDRKTADERLAELVRRARVARAALVPLRIALAGPVNAGKSTLFNLLVARERVVVSSDPGTTRDVVSAPAQLGLWPVVLVDTAGDREDAGAIEREGQERGRRARAAADLVVELVPTGEEASSPEPPSGGPRRIRLRSRADLGEGDPSLPSVTRDDPQAASRVLEEVLRREFDLPASPWIPGAGVPFDDELARGVDELRGLEAEERARRIDAILGVEPRSGVAHALGLG